MLASDTFESYSAGTEIGAQINPDAVRMESALWFFKNRMLAECDECFLESEVNR